MNLKAFSLCFHVVTIKFSTGNSVDGDRGRGRKQENEERKETGKELFTRRIEL